MSEQEIIKILVMKCANCKKPISYHLKTDVPYLEAYCSVDCAMAKEMEKDGE